VQTDYPAEYINGKEYGVSIAATDVSTGYTYTPWTCSLDYAVASYDNVYAISLDLGFNDLVEAGATYTVKFCIDSFENGQEEFSDWVSVPGTYTIAEKILSAPESLKFDNGYLYITDTQTDVSHYAVEILAKIDGVYETVNYSYISPQNKIYVGDALQHAAASDSYVLLVTACSNDTTVARVSKDSCKSLEISPTQDEIANYKNTEDATGSTPDTTQPTQPADGTDDTNNAGSSGQVTTQFTDVHSDDWFADAATYMSEAGYMNGMGGKGSTTFAPYATLTRAQMAQILYNISGFPYDLSFATSFRDINDVDGWYTQAVSYVYVKGYITGYENGMFGVDDSITREQLATILWRYAGKPSVSGSLSAFPDADYVSSYSYDAMVWATQEGIIKGSGGLLNGKSTANRAEVAVMVQRYMQSKSE
jgi:hypothetical protein